MHVMIAVDGSESALRATAVAHEMFGDDAEYTVVSVGSVAPFATISPMGIQPALLTVTGTAADLIDLADQDAEGTATEAAAEFDPDTVEVVSAVGNPANTICHLVEQRNVDLLVIGAHERGWLSRLVNPSVAHHLVDHSPCHVLVVRSEAAEAG